ncbi:MAG: hypothetical protein LIO87_10465, partial [Eubacterium sp.]|nr:hypothetical protein [Eubacterium sp.]
HNSVGIHEAHYQSLMLYYVESVIGLISLISFCKFMGNNVGKNILTPIIFIGQNTLVYYAFQSKGIKMFELIFNMLGFTLDTYLFPMIVTVLVCICLAIPAYIINKWFPFLLGKRNNNS